MRMRDVAISEHHVIDGQATTDPFEVALRFDRNSVRIGRSRQHRRIESLVDTGDLRSRKCNDLIVGIVAINDIEIVKIAAGSTHIQDAATLT